MNRLIIGLILAVCVCLNGYAQRSESFSVRSSEGLLHAELQMPEISKEKKVPLVIICHGFGGNCEAKLLTDIADNLQNHGIASIRFDFNGHGKSEGEFQNMTVLNEIQDLKNIIEWAQTKPWVKNISLLGHSQGGVVVSMTAGELGNKVIKSAVLMAPAAVLRDDALRGNTMGAMYDPWNMKEEFVRLPFGGMKLGREYIKTALTLPIYETAFKYSGPVLVIHGTYDRVVPYTYGERYDMGYKNSKLYLIQGEDHGFSQTSTETSQYAAEWLATHLR